MLCVGDRLTVDTGGYGSCPICGSPVVARSRHLNGNDVCREGHEYPSVQTEPAIAVCQVKGVSQERGETVVLVGLVNQNSVFSMTPEEAEAARERYAQSYRILP